MGLASGEAPGWVRWHGFVSGVVQGVGFRYFVHDEALRLRLTGWVRNRRDGRVEAVVEGEQDSVRGLIDRIRVGPRASRVEAVDGEWEAATLEFSGFKLERTM